jgi:hypothetical protein
MNILTLTAEEEKAFAALPAALRDGWKVVAETLKFDDTEDRLAARHHLPPVPKRSGKRREGLLLLRREGEDIHSFLLYLLKFFMGRNFC